MNSRLKVLLISSVCLVLSAFPADRLHAAKAVPQKAVLVTGASSGIGRIIAERLAREGHYVYAGARKPADIEALSEIDNIQGVRLDVTIQADIDAAVEIIKAGGHRLHGIVNNAGVVTMGILAETQESELDFIFGVNVYGPYRIVKAFAPILIESKGRISNISSMAGMAAPPAYGVYSMSKHAVEAFSASLAFEMGTVGVHVSVIEPGPFKSKAASSICKRDAVRDLDPADSLFEELAVELATYCNGESEYAFPEPDAVADAVLHALFSDQPNYRYLAVTDRRHAVGMLRNQFKTVSELSSSGHAFRFSREELVEMLDAALAP